MPGGSEPANSYPGAFAVTGAAVKRGFYLVNLLMVLLAGFILAGCSVTIGPAPTAGTPLPGQPTNTPIDQVRVDITYVPSPTAGAPTATRGPIGEPIEYKIKSGDTLSGIAQQFGITVEDIVKYNNITDPNAVYEGQTILIPPAGATDNNQTPGANTAVPGANPTSTKVP